MRSSGAVYRKLREVKYRHLVVLYRKLFREIPENCKYNYKYTFMSDSKPREIRLCLLHQENMENLTSGIIPGLIDVCEELHHCSTCNGFVFKYTKEDIRRIFEAELENQKIKTQKYPDICALEWVLERSAVGPLSWIQMAYYNIKRAIFKNKIV